MTFDIIIKSRAKLRECFLEFCPDQIASNFNIETKEMLENVRQKYLSKALKIVDEGESASTALYAVLDNMKLEFDIILMRAEFNRVVS